MSAPLPVSAPVVPTSSAISLAAPPSSSPTSPLNQLSLSLSVSSSISAAARPPPPRFELSNRVRFDGAHYGKIVKREWIPEAEFYQYGIELDGAGAGTEYGVIESSICLFVKQHWSGARVLLDFGHSDDGKIVIDDSRTVIGGVGAERRRTACHNFFGNACYQSSIIRMLSGISDFATPFVSGVYRDWICLQHPLEVCVVHAFSEAICDLLSGEFEWIALWSFKRAFDAVSDKFRDVKQHDAPEFLTELINILARGLDGSLQWKSVLGALSGVSDQNTADLVTHIVNNGNFIAAATFALERTKIACSTLNCTGGRNDRIEPFHLIQETVPARVSVKIALEIFRRGQASTEFVDMQVPVPQGNGGMISVNAVLALAKTTHFSQPTHAARPFRLEVAQTFWAQLSEDRLVCFFLAKDVELLPGDRQRRICVFEMAVENAPVAGVPPPYPVLIVFVAGAPNGKICLQSRLANISDKAAGQVFYDEALSYIKSGIETIHGHGSAATFAAIDAAQITVRWPRDLDASLHCLFHECPSRGDPLAVFCPGCIVTPSCKSAGRNAQILMRRARPSVLVEIDNQTADLLASIKVQCAAFLFRVCECICYLVCICSCVSCICVRISGFELFFFSGPNGRLSYFRPASSYHDRRSIDGATLLSSRDVGALRCVP
jgi:hypothetical protein